VETEIMARLFRHRQTKEAGNRYAKPNVHRATLLLYCPCAAHVSPNARRCA